MLYLKVMLQEDAAKRITAKYTYSSTLSLRVSYYLQVCGRGPRFGVFFWCRW